MGRVEVVQLDAAGNADKKAVLCKSGRDRILWVTDDGPFSITFSSGSPFTSPSFTVPHGGSADSGPPTGTPGLHRYQVRTAAAAGDDGDIIINP